MLALNPFNTNPYQLELHNLAERKHRLHTSIIAQILPCVFYYDNCFYLAPMFAMGRGRSHRLLF